MYKRILYRIKQLIKERDYIITLHAEAEMIDDGITIRDVERGVFTGQITERQKDYTTGEWKYKIEGWTISNEDIVVIIKLSPTGKLVFITVYLT